MEWFAISISAIYLHQQNSLSLKPSWWDAINSSFVSFSPKHRKNLVRIIKIQLSRRLSSRRCTKKEIETAVVRSLPEHISASTRHYFIRLTIYVIVIEDSIEGAYLWAINRRPLVFLPWLDMSINVEREKLIKKWTVSCASS